MQELETKKNPLQNVFNDALMNAIKQISIQRKASRSRSPVRMRGGARTISHVNRRGNNRGRSNSAAGNKDRRGGYKAVSNQKNESAKQGPPKPKQVK